MRDRETIGVLCVDDNEHVAAALQFILSRTKPFEWKGWLPSADELLGEAIKLAPAVVLLDLDMPGRNAFEAVADVVKHCPDTRVLIFSGHVRGDLVERALDAGAWGYVSKNDGEAELVKAIESVAGGHVAMSPEVKAAYDRV